MKFVDEAIVFVRSGDGGRGCVSFRREKYIPRGGPDGGDGGKGGNVVLTATSRKRTLQRFRRIRQLNAQNGRPGQGKCKSGSAGPDIVIEIPVGTLAIHGESGELLHDFTTDGETVILLKGGRGGRGNAHFKSATHRTPRLAQPGEPGTQLTLKLELKLLADVGIIGLPNAGKSTLLSAISAARPKIADYPFTTLTPTLGVVDPGRGEPFAVADIPGLIEGAHAGSGLGVQFLRHVERTRLLVHLVDASTLDPSRPLESLESVNRELALFDAKLAQKPQVVVLNKMDLAPAEAAARRFGEVYTGKDLFRVSAATGIGVQDLIRYLAKKLEHLNERLA